jgi:hypothetical protein
MRKGIASLLIGASLIALSGTAAANPNIGVGISFGIPAPVYVAPRPPVAYYPAPAYVQAPPVYVAPAPVYYSAPAYYAPPVVYRARPHYRSHHHGWHGHRW